MLLFRNGAEATEKIHIDLKQRFFILFIPGAKGHDGMNHHIFRAQNRRAMERPGHFFKSFLAIIFRSVPGRIAPGAVGLGNLDARALNAFPFGLQNLIKFLIGGRK